jgi:hypothetical protein
MSRPPASMNVSQSFRNLPNTVVNSVPKILVVLIVLAAPGGRTRPMPLG